MIDPLTLAVFRGLLAGGRESWANARVTIVLLGSQREELLAAIDGALAEIVRLRGLLDRIHEAAHGGEPIYRGDDAMPYRAPMQIEAVLAEAVKCDACQEVREEENDGKTS